MANIERTGPQLRSKYSKSTPVPRVRSVPDPLGKVAHFILFYSAIKNFTLPPTDFKHSLYGFMKLNSNASNRSEFTKQLPSAPLPCTAGSSNSLCFHCVFLRSLDTTFDLSSDTKLAPKRKRIFEPSADTNFFDTTGFGVISTRGRFRFTFFFSPLVSHPEFLSFEHCC